MNAEEIANIIRECFNAHGECISSLLDCKVCKYNTICNTLNTAWIMVLEGNYYG